MISCTRCGFENEDSTTFCRSCGGFLEWSGKRAEEPAPEPEAEPVEEPVAVAATPGIVTRVRGRIGGGGPDRATTPVPPVTPGVPMDDQPDSDNGSGAEGAEAESLSGATDVTGVVPAVPPGDEPGASPEGEDPSGGPVPVEAKQPTPEARHPEAVLPQTVAARPKVKAAAPVEEVQIGDLICGQCGTGNVPTRRFCRKCAASLEDAVVFHQSRWQRFLQRRRERKVRPAGSRPGVGRHGVKRPGWLTSWVTKVFAVAVVVFALFATVGPFSGTIQNRLRGWGHDVRTFLHPSYTPVHPVSATASSQSLGHPASLAIDGESNTSWQTADGNNGIGQSITINFSKPVNLAKIGVINGDQDSSNSYLSQARPQLVHLAFNGSPATSQNLTLADVSSFQTFGVSSHHTTSVVLTIVSSYQSPIGHNAAIAELEFYVKEP